MDCKTNCQDIIKTLLRSHDRFSMSRPCIVIREYLGATSECDHVVNLSNMRNKYEEFIGVDSVARIRDFNESYTDNNKALQAVVHFNTWNKHQLEQKMTWVNWIVYKTSPTFYF